MRNSREQVIKSLGKCKCIVCIDPEYDALEVDVLSIGKLFKELAFREFEPYARRSPFYKYLPM